MKKQIVNFSNSLSQGLSICLILGVSDVSQADKSVDREASAFMKHYKRAMKLVGSDDWEAAIEEFQAAYDSRTTPRPEMHLYIAKSYVKLGSGAESMKYYRRFLAEAKSMTDSQRQELQDGMREAEVLIEGQARRREIKAREAGRLEARSSVVEAASNTPAKEQAGATATGGDSAQNREKKEESPNQTYKILVSGRKRSIPYSVNIGESENLCTAPCELRAAAGPTVVTVSGPGSKQFQKEVTLPSSPAQMQVQHLTLSRAIAGPILFVLGAGLIGGGSAFLSDYGVRSGGIIASPIMLLHGAVFFFVGLGEMAAIKRSSIRIQPIGGTLAAAPGSLRLAGLDLSPTPDRKGAVASAMIRF